MKVFILLSLLGLFGCQETAKREEPASVEKVSPVEDDLGLEHASFLLQTNVKGLQISGEKLAKKNDLSVGEDIRVINSLNGKTLDDFSLFDWGPVGFKTEDDYLKVFPNVSLEIDYKVDAKDNVIRTTKCNFQKRPDEGRFKSILEGTKSPNPDWEGIFAGILQLAFEGDKKSYDFFMNPDAEAKTYLKNSDGAASTEPILKVLKFMKDNGCSW